MSDPDTTQSSATYFDEAALLAKIATTLSGLQDEREKRAAVVTELRAVRLSALTMRVNGLVARHVLPAPARRGWRPCPPPALFARGRVGV